MHELCSEHRSYPSSLPLLECSTPHTVAKQAAYCSSSEQDVLQLNLPAAACQKHRAKPVRFAKSTEAIILALNARHRHSHELHMAVTSIVMLCMSGNLLRASWCSYTKRTYERPQGFPARLHLWHTPPFLHAQTSHAWHNASVCTPSGSSKGEADVTAVTLLHMHSEPIHYLSLA